MESIEKLRKLLDERGVEWRSDSENITFWKTDADVAAASQGYDGMLWVSARLTPEQAIAATLDTGTCRWEYPQGTNGWLGYMVCSGCGEKFDECVTDTAHYCPNCGRKVVEE